MDGRNWSGTLISLLNDSSNSGCSSEAETAARRIPSLALRSRSSSIPASAQAISTPTPKLVRSDSSDSTTMQRTPSPVTPVGFGFDGLAVPLFSQQKDAAATYPPITHNNPPPHFAYTPGPPQGPVCASAQSSAASSGESHSQSTTKLPGKKNQYPCPLAREYLCQKQFTTSGHAARHAKKHTGKKDAFCPECNKAFARKDNMMQHRRTHQNGRSTSRPDESAPNKRAKTSQSKRARPAPIQQPASGQMVEASPISPASSFGFAESHANLALQPVQAISQYPAELLQQSAYTQNSPYPIAAPYYDPSNMSGLDKLAMAASGESPPQLESPPQPPAY
jgi:hypothetical protein